MNLVLLVLKAYRQSGELSGSKFVGEAIFEFRDLHAISCSSEIVRASQIGVIIFSVNLSWPD